MRKERKGKRKGRKERRGKEVIDVSWIFLQHNSSYMRVDLI